MAYTINTNVASLQAQDYMRTTTDFQNKTINRVTSGLRIVNSGDDAAGLAIANSFRSDRAVLTQGIRNANDGLSSLQTIDAGINNISQLLDRARTLAAQSASGTFTGSRSVLNGEFQSVLGEIDRQAQAIGLDPNGQFAKSLSVFVGGGRDNSGITAIQNGSVSVDLSQSTVDTKSLGLKGMQTVGDSSVDLGAAASTSVQNLLADTTNSGSEVTSGYTVFKFAGPGFADSSKVQVSVNLNGVTDTGTLVTALNAAIQTAGNGASAASTAFKNAGITASVTTDSTGKQHLAFTSSAAAFQVEAGDRMSNALMGNLVGTTGRSLDTTVTGFAASDTGTNTFGAVGAGTIKVRIQGAGGVAPVDLSLTITSAETVATAIADLSSQVTANSALHAAGITMTAAAAGSALTFTSTSGEKFDVQVTGDVQDKLGFGSFVAGTAGGQIVDYTSLQGATYDRTTANGTAAYEISLNGGASNTHQLSVNLAGGDATTAAVTGSVTTATVNTSANVSLDLAIDGTAYNITLNSSATESMSDIAKTITTALGGAGTAVVTGTGALKISSATVGAGGSVHVLAAAANDAATTLGLNGLSNTGQARTGTSVRDDLNAQFAANSDLQAAGLTAAFAGGKVTISSSNNTYFRVNAGGTVAQMGYIVGTKAQNFTTVGGTSDAVSISIDGGAAQTFSIGAHAGATAAAMAGFISAAMTAASITGVTVTNEAGHVKFTSTGTGSSSGITFNAIANDAYTVLGLTAASPVKGFASDLGYGVAGASFTGNTVSAAPANSPALDAGGSNQSSQLTFSPLLYGSDNQTITVTAQDSTGAQKSQNIVLFNNSSDGRNARTIDEAVHAINTALQQSNVGVLQQLVAVKDDASGTEKIRFMGTGNAFKVTVGTNANTDGVGGAGTTDSSAVAAGGATSDIGSQQNAQTAVTALAAAVNLLGASQAVVGRGQNQFSYAVNLASSQLTNLAAAESRIRDADLASEAANLTKAQILQQAGIAALAQANSAPQAVLTLLRG